MRRPLLVFILLLVPALVHAADFVLASDDPRIDYQPAKAWQKSSACNNCPHVDPAFTLAASGAFMNGTHTLPTVDPDDLVSISSRRARIRRKDSDETDDDETKTSHSSSTVSTSSQSSSKTLQTDDPNFTNGPDSDDPNFVDQPVTATFRFTGTSFSLGCIIPSLASPNSSPSTTNVSFTLDGGAVANPFIFTPKAPGLSFQLLPVVHANNLPDVPHVLIVTLAPSSTLLVSFLNYTSQFNTTASSSEASSSQTPVTQRNVATFAGAIGGSVGVLSILVLGLWISIWRRRLLSARRLKQIEEEEAREARRFGLDPEEHVGPIPFVPRFFPGTIPPSPPPYERVLGGDPDITLSEESRPVNGTPSMGQLGNRSVSIRETSRAATVDTNSEIGSLESPSPPGLGLSLHSPSPITPNRATIVEEDLDYATEHTPLSTPPVSPSVITDDSLRPAGGPRPPPLSFQRSHLARSEPGNTPPPPLTPSTELDLARAQTRGEPPGFAATTGSVSIASRRIGGGEGGASKEDLHGGVGLS